MVETTLHTDSKADQAATEAQATPALKIIKRYANRKLYDTVRSKYVTLEEIAEMIKTGDEVQIIDNKNKADLTSATLAQIIFEAEKKQSKMPLSMLRNLIQTSGDALGEFFDKNVKHPVESARDSAQKSAEEIFQGAVQLRDAASRGVTEFKDTARRVFGKGATELDNAQVDAIAAEFHQSFQQIAAQLEKQISAAQETGSAVIDPLIERLSQRLYEIRLQMTNLHQAAKPITPEKNTEDGTKDDSDEKPAESQDAGNQE